MNFSKNAVKVILSFSLTSSPFFTTQHVLTPQALANKKNNKPKKKAVRETAAPKIKINLPPLFPAPQIKNNTMSLREFVARDPNIMGTLDLSREAAANRHSQIRQVEMEFRTQKPRSPQLMQAGDRLMRLREEQALYLENLKGLGLADNRYPDLNFSIRSERNALTNLATQLVAQFPKGPYTSRWKAASLISRLKTGDGSATAEAKAYTRDVKSGDSTRVALVLALYGPYSPGVLTRSLQLPMDSISSAVLKIMVAEKEKVPPKRQRTFYEEAARDGQGIQGVQGRLGPISTVAAFGLVKEALAQSPTQLDPEVVSTLQSLNASDMARYYMELVALNNVPHQPNRAIVQYSDIQNTADISPQFRQAIDFRILDIAIASQSMADIEQQWQKMGTNGLPPGPQVENRKNATLDLAWNFVQKSNSGEAVDRFIRLNDFFSQHSQSTLSTQWSLRIIEALIRAQRYPEGAQRADAIVSSPQKPETQLAALKLAIQAREKILGVSDTPAFKVGARLAGDGDSAQNYVANLDKLQQIVKGPEAQKSAYQAGYILYISGNDTNGRLRLEDSLQKYPSHPLAPKALSFLLSTARAAGQHSAVEKVARMAEKLRITPFSKEHSNLRGIVESAVYSQAESLNSQGQAEPAAEKYVAFQKEFPNSKNGVIALSKAANLYVGLQKNDKALIQLESLLQAYPTHPMAKEARWQAAELANANGQKLKAANHYEAYAQTYKDDGQRRRAYYLAGGLHKGLGRYANAVTDYEIYLKDVKSNEEKLRVSKEIAEIQVKYGKTSDALASLERMNRFNPTVDDEVWSLAYMVDIYLRQGQEASARRTIKRLMSLRPTTQEGMNAQAKAKFALANMDAKIVRDSGLQNERKLLQGVNALLEKYDAVKSLYLSQCEVPGSDSCANGYYQTARLAEDLAKKILEIEIAPTLDPKEVEPLRAAIKQSSSRLASESKAFAIQAEDALSSGNVDGDLAERIRIFSRQQKGIEER